MMRYIVLLNFTDQGIRNVKDSVKRANAFTTAVRKVGGTTKEIYWTQGQYDVVATMEVPNEEAGMALLLKLGSLGNVRSQTLRAFSPDEMKRILAKMP